MNTRTLAAIAGLALLGGSAFAANGYIPAGQGPIDAPPPATSTLTRADVRQQVVHARLTGELVPAGQNADIGGVPTGSTVARATVKSETLQARADGALVPAGEGFDTARVAHHARHARGVPVAFAQR